MENKQLKDEDDIMVTLNLDNGQDVECKILTIFEAGKQDYIALMPLDEREMKMQMVKYISIVTPRMRMEILL